MDEASIVTLFLRLMEARDLAAARALLAPDFVMVFPGGVEMTDLDELAAWSKTRYSRVIKTFDRIDAAGDVVFVSGTLAGDWLDGTAFSGIRYVDRFQIRDGVIAQQDVWNDMAEARAKRA